MLFFTTSRRLTLFFGLLVGALQAEVPAKASNDVFIYYANETRLNEPMKENYAIVSEWLRSDPDKGAEIAEQIARDAKTFPAAVEKEVRAINAGAIERSNFGVAIFTNELAAQGEFEALSPGESFRTVSWDAPGSPNPVLNSMPLAQPSALKRALRSVARVFPPEEHRFFLVTKSHGNEKFAMVPRLSVWHEDSSKREVISVLNLPEDTPPEQLPDWVERTGTSKKDYFEVIQSLGDSEGMEFKLVYLEACDSQAGLRDKVRLPTNVEYLAAPALKLDYRVLPYSSLLRKRGPLWKSSLAFIKKNFPGSIAKRVKKPVAARLKENLTYFAPLLALAVFGVFFALWRRFAGRKPNRNPVKAPSG